MKRNKYNATRTEYNGRVYASKAEAAYAADLDLMLAAGAIREWWPQPAFPLPGGVRYVADFAVIRDNGTPCEIIDVKGVSTAAFRIKFKQAAELYPGLVFRAVQRRGKRWVQLDARNGDE